MEPPVNKWHVYASSGQAGSEVEGSVGIVDSTNNIEIGI